MKHTLFILLFITSFFNSDLSAEILPNFNYRLQSISVNQGLAQHDVSSITQDKFGFIWIATYDGLIRYDGNSFRTFRHDVKDINSICDNRILSVFLDSKDRLWISTEGGGINLYNYEYENFKNYRLGSNPLNNNIYGIFEDNNKLWLGTNGGLFTLSILDDDLKSVSITEIFSDNKHLDNIFSIYVDYKKDVLIGTTSGLYKLSLNNNQYSEPKLIENLHSTNVYAFEKLDAYNVFVASELGVYVFNQKKETFKPILYENKRLKGARAIKKIKIDNHDKFILATSFSGIYGLEVLPNSKFILDKIHIDKKSYFEKSLVKSLFVDKNQNLWIGSGNNGIGKINLLAPKFYRLFDNTEEAGSFVRTFYKDKNDGLWVQIKGEKFFYYKNEETYHLLLDENKLINHISEDSHGNIWACTINDVYIFDSNNPLNPPLKLFNLKEFPEELKKQISGIRASREDFLGNVWIAYKSGVIKIKNFNTPTNSFDPMTDINIVNKDINAQQVYSDAESNRIWICSRDFGLFSLLINENGEVQSKYRYYNSGVENKQLSSNHVWTVNRNSDGKIWIGTDSGVDIIENEGSESFRIYSIEKLKPYKIQTIVEDAIGDVWMNTSMGLIRYTPSNQEIKHFYQSDGLSNSALTECAQIDANGIVYVSTINGLTMFKPSEITQNPFKPDVLLTDFYVYNRLIKVGDKINGRILLQTSLQNTKKITLKHNENNFSFEFSGIHFANSSANKYAHKLIGYDKEWVYTNPDKRIVNYNNLKAGEYVFCVKAANSDGLWSESFKLMNINVRIAPWYSWWALLLYIILFFGIIYVIIRYYVRHKELQIKLWTEKKERQHDLEINNVRLQFHTNITHELRTPLTLILSPLNEILNHNINDEFISERLTYINNNAQRLSNLVNQFLDLRKIDKNSMSLKVVSTNSSEFFISVSKDFIHLMRQKNITFKYENVSIRDYIYIDQDKLIKIISNLMSNAIKYTAEGGDILLSIKDENEFIVIDVHDTGCGIKNEDLEHIFDRFYQVESNKVGGTGIGLSLMKELVLLHHGDFSVQSEYGKGSKFTVKIPVTTSSYLSNEMFHLSMNEEQKTEVRVSDEIPVQEKFIVLVIEDDIDMRNYLNTVLSPFFDVLLESNGLEGYKTAMDKVPDLILTDWMMPEVSGIDLVKQLKGNVNTSHIPVIILTAKSSQSDYIEGYDAGVEMYLTKPFVPEQLVLQIRNIITYRRPNLTNNSEIEKKEELINKNVLNEREQKFINKIISYLEENLDKSEYGIETLCRDIGMSRMQLHRKLTALTGYSTSEYIRNYRMARAKEFLEQGNYNVSEVIYQVGFKSNSHFAKTFKDTYGISPSELLKSK